MVRFLRLPSQEAREKRGISKHIIKFVSCVRRGKPIERPQDEENTDGCTVKHEGTRRRGKSVRKVLARIVSNRVTTSKGKERGLSELRSDTEVGGRDEVVFKTPDSTPRESISRVIMPRPRSVSFSDVVKELPIETRKQRYGDVARKREAFYSHAELATFKRAWYWHDHPNDCPRKGLIGRGCRSCDEIDERPSTEGMEVLSLVQDASLEDFTKWIWEG